MLVLIMILHRGRSGVLAVSWYPPGMKDDNGEPTEDIVPLILEVAAKYKVKVEVFLSSLLFFLPNVCDFVLRHEHFFLSRWFFISSHTEGAITRICLKISNTLLRSEYK